MGTLLIDDPVQTDDLLSFERISSGWATGTAWDQAWATNPVTGIYRQAELAQTGINATTNLPIQTIERIGQNQAHPNLTPDEADARYGIEGELSFSDYAENGIPEAAAKSLHDWKQQEIQRRDILSRATPGFLPGAGRLGAMFAASALDPINIGSAFIPVLREARFAALARSIGLPAARVARGALEGAAGQAAIEPLILLQARTEQSDYDMYDSLLNITFGTLLGAGLHAGGGFVKDRIVGRPDLRPEVSPRVEAPAMTAETHHAALSGAVAAVAEDRPVIVADLVRATSRRDALMTGTALGRSEPLAEPRLEPEPGSVRAPAEEAAARRVASVEARAREIDPQTFTAYDALAQEKATYARWIDELSDGRTKTADVAELDRKIAEAEKKLADAPNQRKAKTYQSRLDDLKAERESRVADLTARDTPDMAKVREKMMRADQGMRDLAEKVSAAKRRADAEIPAADANEFGFFGEPDPLDRPGAMRADTPTFDQLWEQTRQQQTSTARPSEIAALSAADAKAKDFARPATIESESKALADWAANDTELVNQQRAAGNLDEADEALLKEGDATEQTHLNAGPMSHRVSEGARMALLIVCTLGLGALLCLGLAGAVQLSLAWPDAAPVLVILFSLVALAAAYLGFRALVSRLL